MLTNSEIKLIDRYLSIHERYVDKPIFYSCLANIVPTHRAEQLFESNAYEDYIENLVTDFVD